MADTAGARPRLGIVGIGASAGGIEAFRGFFENMPADSGLGFVVVLHLPADRKSILPEILARWTRMPIVEVSNGCLVEANQVYVPPSGVSIILRRGRLHLHPPIPFEPREPSPISMFFDSLARELREDAVGIVLSGTGNDGALGLKAIKEAGGLTLVQGTTIDKANGATNSAPQHAGMPASAIATGAVDIIASVEAMPGHILTVQAARHGNDNSELPAEQSRPARLAICAILNRQLGHDFAGYKDKTFLRRVQRRMLVLRMDSLDSYVARLENDRAEGIMLFNDLLIGVTSFFRDTETFDVLKRVVVPRLFDGRGSDTTIRVWVAGCATGEEAYSLAILLREYMDQQVGGHPRVQIFATDIDDASIATARAGRYPSTLLEGLPPERLARFFLPGSDGGYTVTKDVRELCTFSGHSLTRDPPFSRINLVSCRNLLIYLDSDLQSSVIPAFHYSLVPNGILLLGSSETVSRHEALFEPLDRTHRIYLRRDGPAPPLRLLARSRLGEVGQPPGMVPSSGLARAGSRLNNRATTRVLDRFSPPFVVVTATGEIMQFSSRTGRYLEPATGGPTQNVLDMARRGLRGPLRAALKQAVETSGSVERPRLSVQIEGVGIRRVTLVVDPIPEPGSSPVYLIVFVEVAEEAAQQAAQGAPSPDGRENADLPPLEPSHERQYEAELRDTREQLQFVTEEHDTAVEELRSANEELHSVNEELQSANEELETSKEEIQSINEELQTVNGQLASKVDEQDRRNADLQNLFESTQVATIFLDPYLVVRGFTPAVTTIYNLIPSDQGRPLTDIVSHLRYGGLREDVHTVLTTLAPLERRVVRDDDTTHYLMRILPYRTPDSSVDGVIVTFVDVTSIVQAEQHQRLLVNELNHRVKNMLTVVISLATQTMHHATTMEEFSRIYMGRIHALTAAYSLLSSEGWQTVSLRDIVLEELRPFALADGANMQIDGPLVQLEPRAALALGMALHELTTNAVKYGALSVPVGRVSVTWRLEQETGVTYLSLDWIEQGGPPVDLPTQHGFGMTLIERGLRQGMAAEVKVDFALQGVRARVLAPLGRGIATQPYLTGV